MPLLGLLDWTIICLIALIIEAGIICILLALLHEWLSFKPDTIWRPSTHYTVEPEEGREEWDVSRYIEAPRNYNENVYNRGQKLKWYHHLIFQ